ncbi:LysE family translocator [Oceanospirillum maris]|uniref:LysE family translocator n=1 Tax=Oceanospirillum maris TaxID=64977 RepID=UPI000413AFCF|nr:LysE family translocator [Oceanospirillum maris]
MDMGSMFFSIEGFYLPVALFVLSTAGTPGPNNIILTATGAQFGYWKTLPVVYGVIVGMASQLLMVAAGLGLIFQQWPVLHTILKFIGGAYLIWLAIKILRSPAHQQTAVEDEQPISFIQMALFQYLNPKAWVMTLSMVSAFSIAGEAYWSSVLMIILVAFVVMNMTQNAWAGFGSMIGHLLTSDKNRMRFNMLMATLTTLSVYFVLR